jgi:hypothetical protein
MTEEAIASQYPLITLLIARAFCVIAAEYSFGESASNPLFPEFV